MSWLYPEPINIKTHLEVHYDGQIVKLTFTCNGGKFGTDEQLDEFEMPIDKLLRILQNNEK